MEDNSRVALMKNRTRDLENIVNALGWELSELRTNNSHSYIVYQVARADLSESVIHKFARVHSGVRKYFAGD